MKDVNGVVNPEKKLITCGTKQKVLLTLKSFVQRNVTLNGRKIRMSKPSNSFK